jgi:pimeloyl-ACP methyl ester carboxylesterase
MKVSTLTLGGRRLETVWWGPAPTAAPTLVLLHEGLGCVSLWRDIPEQLAKMTGWGVFAYSRLGYGQSDPRPLPWPLTYMHQEAHEVLPWVIDTMGIRETVLVGHSDGGSIAAIYAGNIHDTRLRGLVVIAAHFYVEDVNIASIEQIRDEYQTGTLRKRMARHHRHPDIAFLGWNDVWLHPDFRAFDITADLAGITVPTLAMQGEDDPYGTEGQLHVLQRRASGPLTTMKVPGARHAPHLEAKHSTLAAISDFVRSVPRS